MKLCNKSESSIQSPSTATLACDNMNLYEQKSKSTKRIFIYSFTSNFNQLGLPTVGSFTDETEINFISIFFFRKNEDRYRAATGPVVYSLTFSGIRQPSSLV
jgi:hypothetical protein